MVQVNEPQNGCPKSQPTVPKGWSSCSQMLFCINLDTVSPYSKRRLKLATVSVFSFWTGSFQDESSQCKNCNSFQSMMKLKIQHHLTSSNHFAIAAIASWKHQPLGRPCLKPLLGLAVNRIVAASRCGNSHHLHQNSNGKAMKGGVTMKYTFKYGFAWCGR